MWISGVAALCCCPEPQLPSPSLVLIPREALALPLNPVIYGIIYAVNADRMTGETDSSIANGKLQKLNLSVAMTSRQKEHKETEGSTRNNPTWNRHCNSPANPVRIRTHTQPNLGIIIQ